MLFFLKITKFFKEGELITEKYFVERNLRKSDALNCTVQIITYYSTYLLLWV